MKKLETYLDYQQYLREYYEEKKESNFFFSYRYIAGKLKIDPSLVVKVFQGKRHLPDYTLDELDILLGHSEVESEYFRALYAFNRAKGDEDVKECFRKLLALSGREAETLELSQYSYYSKWYHSAIRSYIGMYGFHGDYVALSKALTPVITVSEAQEAIKVLLENGLLQVNEDDSFSLTNKSITTGDEWRALAVRIFQEEALDLAKHSLNNHAKEVRDISTMTIGCSQNDFKEIADLAREFRQSILQIKSTDKADTVYQINVQIFPMTNPKGEDHA